MSTSNLSLLMQEAKEVLERNWTGRYTKPAPGLYPHQWNWDSGFIAIGYSHYALERACTELLSLFQGQWKNGMLPHIVYHDSSSTYFPNPALWEIEACTDAPHNVDTSGLTQPPIHATAAWAIYLNAGAKRGEALGFLRSIFHALLASHRFLHTCRDVDRVGLAANIHPWETGVDNSPKWDRILKQVCGTNPDAVRSRRKDLEFVAADQRPSNETYAKFLKLIELLKQCRYVQADILQRSPFCVYDVLFNSILYRADLDLLKIAVTLKEETREIEKWIQRSWSAFEDLLWDPVYGAYYSYDIRAGRRIRTLTASCALPLYATIPDRQRARRIRDRLHTICPFHNEEDCVAVPTYDECQNGYEASNYWRGPIWININWMICRGLQSYGIDNLALKIRRNIIRLVADLGFREYYYPTEAHGLGSDGFSWTAALLIDILSDPL